MTSLRKLLFVVPAFVAVGIAAACSPYIGPIIPPSTPASPPSGISMPQPAQPPSAPTMPQDMPPTVPEERCVPVDPRTPPPQITVHVPPPRVVVEYPAAAGVPGTSLSVLDGKILVQTVDGSRMVCEKFTILVSGAEPAEVAVKEKLVTITSGKKCPGLCCMPSSTDCLQASAQKVKRIGADGATLVLEGNAKLVYVRGGKKIEVSTELLQVNLLTGQVISEMEMRPVQPLPAAAPDGRERYAPPPTDPQTFREPSPYKVPTDPLMRLDSPPVGDCPPPAPPGTSPRP